jgi:hypothetical protein
VQPKSQKQQITSPLPYLWVPEDLQESIPQLRKHFRIATPGIKPTPGYHIVALKSERSIRQVLRSLQLTPDSDIRIFPADLLLFESLDGLMMKAQPAERWLEITRNGSIKFPDAQAIARDALHSLYSGEISRNQWNMEKEELRQRCGVSPFDWNQYIRDLEAEIHAAVDGKQTIDPSERKRLELKALAQERDPYKFTDKLIEFCRRTGWSRRDTEQQIRLLKTSTVAPKAKRLKGKDFLALETESISWIFAGIIPSRGVVVLGGHAGAGKTTLAYDAGGSLLLNEEFLGEKPVKAGKVLIVTGDELPCFTQDKLIDRGIPLDNENWDIILNWDVSQWHVLEEAIADLRPTLVIIDSFSSIHRDPSFDENSSQAKATIYDLEALTNAYNCGCILIHHLSKSKENQGVAKLRGSSAISAAASVVCLVESMSNGTRKLTFPKVRGAQTEPFLVQLRGASGRYEVLSGGDDSGAKSLGDRILAFLQKSPYKRYEQVEISQALGIHFSHQDSVYQALSRLFKRGLITKRPSQLGGKRKVYGVSNPQAFCDNNACNSVLSNVTGTMPDNPQETLPPPPVNVSVQIPVNIDISKSEVPDSLADSSTDSFLTPQSDVSSDSSSNVELESDSPKLTNIDSQGCVCPASVTVTSETVIVNIFAVGEQVMVGGMLGTVMAINFEWSEAYRVDTDTSTNWYAASDIQKLREPKVGDRVQHGEFTGTLAAKGKSGWFVVWNRCASLVKRFPAPPAILREDDLRLL